jgi:predicted dehydrogenase
MEYTVSADGGTIDYSTDNRPPTLYKFDGEKEALDLETVDGYAAEIAYFAECVNEGKQPLVCSPRDSANAVHLAHVLLASRAAGGQRLTL